VEHFRKAGKVQVSQSKNDPQVADGKYATARLEITLTNIEGIVPDDDGVWAQVRKGLSVSVSALLKSVEFVVFGLCVVLPWALIGFGGYRMVRRAVKPTPPPVTPPSTPAPSAS
jgi:hypothetical protein